MKIGIHQSNDSYSRHWIAYCTEKNIPFKIVNCYDTNIIRELSDCDALMWHHNHANPKDVLFAKELIFSLETAGKYIYPDSKTTWHFNDKLAQKYLFDALHLPSIPTYVFYSREDAINWVSNAEFPVVFKLRGGAGGKNVKLLKSKSHAKKTIKKAFRKGIRQYNAANGIKESIRAFASGKTNFKEVLKSFVHIIYPIQLEKSKGREKGYVYFQEFLPDCEDDIRVKIVGGRIWAVRRRVRKNDFRASGSGNYDYDHSRISDLVLNISLKLYRKLEMQTVAFDFIEFENSFYLVEISYAFGIDAKQHELGYWDENLVFHPGVFNPFGWMVEDLLNKCNAERYLQ